MMMKNYVILDDDGVYPVGAGANSTVPDGAVEVDWDAFHYTAMMLVDGLWIHRPAITDPVVSSGVVTFSNLPVGATITITDRETQEILAVTTDAEFQLLESAEYGVGVTPPLPYLPWFGVVSC